MARIQKKNKLSAGNFKALLHRRHPRPTVRPSVSPSARSAAGPTLAHSIPSNPASFTTALHAACLPVCLTDCLPVHMQSHRIHPESARGGEFGMSRRRKGRQRKQTLDINRRTGTGALSKVAFIQCH